MAACAAIGLGWGLEARLVGFAWSLAVLVLLAAPCPREDQPVGSAVDRLMLAIERVDERARALDRAATPTRESSETLARIGRSIRTPLAGILGTSELLLTTDLDDVQQEYAVAIANHGVAMLKVVDAAVEGLESEQGDDTPVVAEAPARVPSATGKRVLVVDDRELVRKVATRLLERIGCVVVAVEGGERAVHLTGREAFDLILMDYRMPTLDGIDATRMIRRREARSGRGRASILAFSAGLSQAEHLAWSEAGMDGLILKPATRSSLEGWLTAEGPIRAEPSDHTPDFDAEGLLERCGGDEQLVAEILASFLDSTPRSVEAIRRLLEAGDFPRLSNEAHGLKGAAETILASGLARASRALEFSGDAGSARDAAEDLFDRWEKLRATLEAFVGGPNP